MIIVASAYIKQIKPLITQLAKMLRSKDAYLVTVESCTGGGLGYYCTAEPGASLWYQCGYITYHNEDKISLGVPSSTIEKYGAISTECAEAMAMAAATRHSKHHYISTITGIAGPEGGSRAKPIGTVCFGWQGMEGNRTAIFYFNGDREAIRLQAILYSLKGLISLLSHNANYEENLSS